MSLPLKAKNLILLGALLIVLPPAILFIKFGQAEITGSAAWFAGLASVFSLAGILLIVIGLQLKHPNAPDVIVEKLHLNNPVMNTLVKRRSNWISYFVLAAIWLPAMISTWKPSSIEGELVNLLAWLFPAAIVLSMILGKLIWKAPWYVTLIGDVDLNPKDERESVILRKSAQYTLALSVLFFVGLYEVFLLAPKPSPTALVDLMLSYLFLIRGTYGFIAWKLGLR